MNVAQKSFKYLDDLIHSGAREIVLDSDIVLAREELKKYLDGIKIDLDDIVIDGNGFSIDACNQTRIFLCTGKNVTIKNILLKNGISQYGGAIYNEGELTIEKGNLTENIAKYIASENHFKNHSNFENTGAYGGTIYNKAKLTVVESRFVNNGVSNKTDRGGAIYNDKGKLTLIKSNFTKNSVWNYGGAVYSLEGEVIIEESIFERNFSGDGGAIYNNNSRFVITDSLFDDNYVRSFGGAILNKNGEMILRETNLKNNTIWDGGGVISSEKSKLTLLNSTLDSNIVKDGKGGAIYNNECEVIIKESEFINNCASETGGAIDNYKSNTTITETNFVNNSSDSGGAIYNYEGNFKIFNCTISNNKSLNTIILNNDALQIYNTKFKKNQSKHILLNEGEESNLGIFYGELIKNNSEESVICNNGKFCSIDNTIFENNISIDLINLTNLTLISPIINDEGKRILNKGHVLLKSHALEDEEEYEKLIHALESKIDGEGIVEKHVPITTEKFDFGYLDKKIHKSNAKEIILDENICFENYEMDFYEGGIELDIDDLVIDGNGKIIDGAGKSRIFIITGENITLKNIIFKNGYSHKSYDNLTNNNGGAIRNNHMNKLIIENCAFINNKAEMGGAIENKGDLTMNNSTLTENIANLEGGAIQNIGNLNLRDSIIVENKAEEYGGAIHNIKGEANIIKTEFRKNLTNKDGGAILNRDKLKLIESFLIENKAERYGGGIQNREGELEINKTSFIDNIANLNGGAIMNNSEWMIVINESEFTNNYSWRDGGAIYNFRGKLTIMKTTLNNNKIGYGYGGAISNIEKELIIKNSNLYDNTAGGGGAVSNSKGEVNIVETILNNNIAKNIGGAIYNFDGELILRKSTLSNNTASEDGGAIYSQIKKNINLKTCEMKNNSPNNIGHYKLVDKLRDRFIR